MKKALVRVDPVKPVFGRRGFASRRSEPAAGLRQIDEFTTTLRRIRRGGIVAAGALIVFSVVCVGLARGGIDVAAVYSAGALVLLLQMLLAGVAYSREEKRAARAYWEYLDGFTFQALARLASVTRLSVWSRYEVDRYLAASHIVW